MKKWMWVGFILIFTIACLLFYFGQDDFISKKCGDGICDEKELNNPSLCPQDCIGQIPGDSPYYFIAIHNEPAHESPQGVGENYLIMKEMVDEANKYNIKLTIMLSAQWADYILENDKLDEVRSWSEQGHEIAAHHHSVRHGSWDGYTDYSEEEAREIRLTMVKEPETYLGTLDDFWNKLQSLGVGDIKSGCVNEEADKMVMPDQIVYATCSGYANFGEPGIVLNDHDPSKAINDYVVVDTVNGIERKWLAHSQVYQSLEESVRVLDSAESDQVFGLVVHSTRKGRQDKILYDFMKMFNSRDSDGKKSMTVSEIIESGVLPEEHFEVKGLASLGRRFVEEGSY